MYIIIYFIINYNLLKKNVYKMPGYIENIRILKTLGKGASCKVKLGFNNETNTKVAVKILSNNIDKNTYNLVMSEV